MLCCTDGSLLFPSSKAAVSDDETRIAALKQQEIERRKKEFDEIHKKKGMARPRKIRRQTKDGEEVPKQPKKRPRKSSAATLQQKEEVCTLETLYFPLAVPQG